MGVRYELGTNRLIETRAEETFVYDDLPMSTKGIPKQPDRVVGLTETKSFSRLLNLSSTGESIRSTPFAKLQDPLLFPFLILEAKQDRDSAGFEGAQRQTAFPIRELLRLQRGVYDLVPGSSAAPLVWFIANRGDDWRVYACYIDEAGAQSYVWKS